MQLDSPHIRLAREAKDAEPAGRDRIPAAVTLAGCLMTLAAAVVPWGEEAVFGVSLASTQGNARILLGALAAVSVGIAAVVLLRRPGTGVVALVLSGLAAGQIGAATWFGLVILDEVRQADAHLILINAIGTGIYMSAIGAVTALAGAFLAWTRRRTG
jgi:hypothetical protein